MARWFDVVLGDFILMGSKRVLLIDTTVTAGDVGDAGFVAGCASKTIVAGDEAGGKESFDAVTEPDNLVMLDGRNVDDTSMADALVDSPTTGSSLLAAAISVRSHPFAVAIEVGSRDRSVHDLVVAIE